MTYSTDPKPEPKQAFPYTPPTDEIKIKYSNIFKINKPLPPRFLKLAFDKAVCQAHIAYFNSANSYDSQNSLYY